tara:strand:+ start:397 stop:522 length:126 start_codon:yes stop_codon:yes gene_type:complete
MVFNIGTLHTNMYKYPNTRSGDIRGRRIIVPGIPIGLKFPK